MVVSISSTVDATDFFSELGLATHYVTPGSISDIVRQISEHPSPTIENVSALIASYAPATPSGNETNSKSSPDASTPITGEIRRFLDATFSKSSLTEVYQALEEGEKDEGLSSKVRDWAREQKATLDAKSPSGMAVALAAFKKARKAQRLDKTLMNDMMMATAFAVSHLHVNWYLADETGRQASDGRLYHWRLGCPGGSHQDSARMETLIHL